MERQDGAVCDRDCFHCAFPDCIAPEEEISPEERAWSEQLDRETAQDAAHRAASDEAARRERARAYRQAYYAANRERIREYSKRYWAAAAGGIPAAPVQVAAAAPRGDAVPDLRGVGSPGALPDAAAAGGGRDAGQHYSLLGIQAGAAETSLKERASARPGQKPDRTLINRKEETPDGRRGKPAKPRGLLTG